MTVQANDNVWCPAPQHVTSAKSNADQKSRDANSVDRKSRDSSVDGCDRNRTTVSGADLDRKSRVGTDRISDGEALLKVPAARVGGGRRVTSRGSASATEFFTSGGGGGGGGGGSGGSEPETDGESEGASFLSAPETMPPKKPCRDTRNKMRFKKFFRPLRRAKSIGNAKEVSSSSSSSSSSCTSSSSSSSASSSSAFSFHNKRESDSADDRRSVDTGRGSMEPLSDREIEEDGAMEKEASNKDRKKKSIATEMKEKLESLRRRYADLTTNQKEGKSEKPSAETIKNWSKAIEHLLADKFGIQCFHAFLKSEFSEENIEFWMSCEAYKGLKGNKQQQQAQKIFAEYITHQAPREINIDSVTRDLTCSKMVQPDPTTFDAAQKRIQALMDKDSYPRFIQSTLYQELVSGTSPLLLS